ncbi:MAG: hypothetical protein LKF93_09640 [Bifidobacterium tibiigranuli]|jgi:hypothetical protein|nr:hypothetical protein [Bifidobacterium tibiigranuli]
MSQARIDMIRHWHDLGYTAEYIATLLGEPLWSIQAIINSQQQKKRPIRRQGIDREKSLVILPDGAELGHVQ